MQEDFHVIFYITFHISCYIEGYEMIRSSKDFGLNNTCVHGRYLYHLIAIFLKRTTFKIRKVIINWGHRRWKLFFIKK